MLDALPEYEDNSDIMAFSWMKTLSKDSYFEVKLDRYRTSMKYDVDESLFGNSVNYTDNNRNMILDHTENLPADQQITWYDVEVNNSSVLGYYEPGTLGKTFYRLRWNIDEKKIYHIKAYYFDQLTKNHQLKAGFGGKMYDIYDFDIDLASGGNYYFTEYEAQPYSFEIFAEDKMEYGDFIMRLGMRFDYFHAEGEYPADANNPYDFELQEIINPQKAKPKTVLSPRIGISHPITTNDVIYFNYGKYTQIPRMDRLYDNANFSFRGAFPRMGNVDIGYEETVAYEIGLKHSFNMKTKLEVKGFFKDITGLVDTRGYNLSAGIGYDIFVNHDYGTIRGLEFTLRRISGRYIDGMLNYSYQFAQGKSSSATQNYSYAWSSTVVPTKENPLDWDQRHTVTATINARIPDDRNLFGTSVFNNLMASVVF
ncbi:MAG: TonB-dependent receptor, partial [Calditrichia bacterium]|nr:TonB-dependent receptor [Calditrichia bacterium]